MVQRDTNHVESDGAVTDASKRHCHTPQTAPHMFSLGGPEATGGGPGNESGHRPGEPDSVPADLPPGVESVKQWGQTLITFGRKHKGESYDEVVSNQKNEQYIAWVCNHAKGGALRDFLDYIEHVQPQGQRGSRHFIPGTKTIRTFKINQSEKSQ